jgi:predicted SAM-dependent methyltransferase
MTTAQPAFGRDTILNLGCGNKHVANAVNLDVTCETNPDLVYDLNLRPWPFADNSFTEVRANDVIEHLSDIVATMEEIHRICRPDAIVRISVPHFSCANAFTDPTHRHYFSYFSMDYFTTGHELSFYSKRRFRNRITSLVFHPTLTNKPVWRLANRHPAEYERRWAWIFPAWFLSYELEVVK